jgi:hypothetical protein
MGHMYLECLITWIRRWMQINYALAQGDRSVLRQLVTDTVLTVSLLFDNTCTGSQLHLHQDLYSESHHCRQIAPNELLF